MSQFTPVETIMYRGYHIDIYPDPEPLNPYTEFGEEYSSPEELQAYLDGDVYGFIVRETEDSVWGFFGLDLTDKGPICWYAYDSIDTHIAARANALAQLDLFDAAQEAIAS